MTLPLLQYNAVLQAFFAEISLVNSSCYINKLQRFYHLYTHALATLKRFEFGTSILSAYQIQTKFKFNSAVNNNG